MTIFLHVGLHKTGTSSIQSVLSANHDTLLSHGVDFPLLGGRQGVAKVHQLFAIHLRGGRITPEQEALVKAWRPTHPHTIISAEGLSRGDPAMIERARAFFGDDVHVICALRDPIAHIQSHHLQRSKVMLTTLPLSGYLAEHHAEMTEDAPGAYYRYDDKIRRWRSAFPVSTLAHRPDGNMVDDFLDIVGVRQIVGDYDPALSRRNSSINAETAALMRVLKRLATARQLDAATLPTIRTMRRRQPWVVETLQALTVQETVDFRAFKADFARFSPTWAHLLEGTPDMVDAIAGFSVSDEAVRDIVADELKLRL